MRPSWFVGFTPFRWDRSARRGTSLQLKGGYPRLHGDLVASELEVPVCKDCRTSCGARPAPTKPALSIAAGRHFGRRGDLPMLRELEQRAGCGPMRGHTHAHFPRRKPGEQRSSTFRSWRDVRVRFGTLDGIRFVCIGDAQDPSLSDSSSESASRVLLAYAVPWGACAIIRCFAAYPNPPSVGRPHPQHCARREADGNEVGCRLSVGRAWPHDLHPARRA